MTSSSLFPKLIKTKAQTPQSSSQLLEASISLTKAFNAILDAEKTGANVTDLLQRLNYGLNLYTQAEIESRTSDNNSEVIAATVINIASEIETQAINEKKLATYNNRTTLATTAGLSVISLICFLLFMLLTWILFRKNYAKRIDNYRPEMKINETS